MTQLEVYNTALLRAGVSETIASLTENTKNAKLCNRLYTQVRDYVLRDFPWNFATRMVTLALSGTAPTNWEYQYAYPSDCLKVREVVSAGGRVVRTDLRIPFEIGNDGTSRVIWTNEATAELCYTARVEDLTQWDPLTLSALAWALTAELAAPLSVKGELAQRAQSGYAQAVHASAASMANEAWFGPEPMNAILSAREYNG